MTKIIPGFLWDENLRTRYTEGLNSNVIKTRIEHLMNDNNINPLYLATEVEDILISNAKKCKLKKKKSQRNRDHPSAAWFDQECQDEKIKLGELSKLLKQNPHDDEIRTELFNQKRKFRKLVKKKKYQYKYKIIETMKNMKNKNQKEFWKVLKKISPNTSVSGGITPGTFAKYFQSILNNRTTTVDIPVDEEIGPLDYDITIEEVKYASFSLNPNPDGGGGAF